MEYQTLEREFNAIRDALVQICLDEAYSAIGAFELDEFDSPYTAFRGAVEVSWRAWIPETYIEIADYEEVQAHYGHTQINLEHLTIWATANALDDWMSDAVNSELDRLASDTEDSETLTHQGAA